MFDGASGGVLHPNDMTIMKLDDAHSRALGSSPILVSSNSIASDIVSLPATFND